MPIIVNAGKWIVELGVEGLPVRLEMAFDGEQLVVMKEIDDKWEPMPPLAMARDLADLIYCLTRAQQLVKAYLGDRGGAEI